MDKLKVYDLLQEVVQLKHSLATIINDYENEHRSFWQEFKKTLSFGEIKLIKAYASLCKLEEELIKQFKS